MDFLPFAILAIFLSVLVIVLSSKLSLAIDGKKKAMDEISDLELERNKFKKLHMFSGAACRDYAGKLAEIMGEEEFEEWKDQSLAWRKLEAE